jgi:hypothetical protein
MPPKPERNVAESQATLNKWLDKFIPEAKAFEERVLADFNKKNETENSNNGD